MLCEENPTDRVTSLAISQCPWVVDNIHRDIIFEENKADFEGPGSVKIFLLAYKADPLFGATIKIACSIVVTTSWIYLCEERFETYLEDNKVTPHSIVFFLCSGSN